MEAVHLDWNVYPDIGSAHEVHSLFRSLNYPTTSVKLLRPLLEELFNECAHLRRRACSR